MRKRAFDIVAALLGLALLWPVFLAVAAWIRLDSPGPVFFRQERVGRGGVPFRIHKFRTMRVDAPALGPQITVGDDPRITRAGRWLRRTKLDELPQLFDAADPHQVYVQQIMPAKLGLAARYVDEHSMWGDLRLIGATLARLWGR